MDKFEPNWAVPPGETIKEAFEFEGFSEGEFAEKMGMTLDSLRLLLSGETLLTPDIAKRLKQLLIMPEKFWLALERNYRKALKRVGG